VIQEGDRLQEPALFLQIDQRESNWEPIPFKAIVTDAKPELPAAVELPWEDSEAKPFLSRDHALCRAVVEEEPRSLREVTR
jgi:hypothetical protein